MLKWALWSCNMSRDSKCKLEQQDITQKGALHFAIEVRGRHMRRVQSATVVNFNGLDTAAMRGGFEERDDLLWAVESVVIPGEGKLVTPARAW